jgi:hypothetical protein
VVSPDTEFRRLGDKSGVNYLQMFRDYKKFIIAKADTPAMQRTITYLNKEVFLGMGSSSDDRQEDVGEDHTDQLAAAIAGFGLGDDDEEDDTATTDVPQPSPIIPGRELTPVMSGQPRQQNASAGPSRQPTEVAVAPQNIEQAEDQAIEDISQEPVKRATRSKTGGSRARRGAKGKEKADK